MPELPIDRYWVARQQNYQENSPLDHIVLRLMPHSAANTTGRSRTALNRIVLVAKGGCIPINFTCTERCYSFLNGASVIRTRKAFLLDDLANRSDTITAMHQTEAAAIWRLPCCVGFFNYLLFKTNPVDSNSFVGFDQIHIIYTGKVFPGTSCLVGIAEYANPNISSLYFLSANFLVFVKISIPIQTTSWKIIKPYAVIIIKTPSLSRLFLMRHSTANSPEPCDGS